MALSDNHQVIAVADSVALAKAAADRIMARIAENGLGHAFNSQRMEVGSGTVHAGLIPKEESPGLVYRGSGIRRSYLVAPILVTPPPSFVTQTLLPSNATMSGLKPTG